MKQWLNYQNWHKWLAAVVGVQLLLWITTGLYFNLIDGSTMSGNKLRQSVSHQSELHQTEQSQPLVDISDLLTTAELSSAVKQVVLIYRLGKPYYLLSMTLPAHSYQTQQQQLVNAITGEYTTINQQQIAEIAQLSYKGEGQVMSIELQQPPFADIPKQKNDLWQVRVNDEFDTTIYLDKTGKVIEHVNQRSRFHQLMFKLHFMDYFNQGGFNAWLTMLFSALSLMFAITGMVWLIKLINQKQIRWQLFSLKQAVEFQNETGEVLQYKLSKSKTWLTQLLDNQINVASSCGGGGRCGQCRVALTGDTQVTDAELQWLSEQELEQGVRLSCQQYPKKGQQAVLKPRQSRRRIR